MQPDDDKTQAVTVLLKGTLINHYRIIEKIGSGGMGEVYLAEDMSLNRKVVLKFLTSSLAKDSELRQRFIHEAQAAAKLSHPNVVTVHEVSKYKDIPYFAMEYIHGRSLSEVVKEGLPSVDEVTNIASQVCEGLHAAHEAGMIHRDIKPANIMIDDKGRVRILDFGLAKFATSGAESKPGGTVGTISYMSPEQITGATLTPASDLFSFGIVLYQMLTGKLPFVGDYEAAVVYAIVNEIPRNPVELRPDVPKQLEKIVLRLLQKDANERYQSARQVLDDLRACRVHESDRAQERRARFDGKRILYAILIFMVALFLVFGLPSLVDVFKHPPPTRKVLAVLPFENLGAPEESYFADGMTDAITTNLAKHGELSVISRASTVLYKQTPKTPHEIGSELGATYLLTGAIQWDKSETPNLIKISTSLTRAEDNTLLWTESYERVFNKIFAVQSDIATDVTHALNIAVGGIGTAGIGGQPTANLAAYDFYLRGNDYFNRSWEMKDIAFAIQMYEHAVELDSTFALAYAMLARGHASTYWEYFDRSERRLQQAENAVTKALQLQPDLVEGHLANGYCYYHCHLDYDKALAEFAIALKSQPNNADLYNAIAAVERRQGKLERSAQGFVKALELDPRSPLKAFDVGLTYGMMRELAQADRYLDRTIALAPDWPLAYIYKAWLPVLMNGDTAEARRVLADASGRVDLGRSKYYWWLNRVIEPNLEKVLSETKLGTDTVAYYLQVAQINRLMGNNDRERAYADSARRIVEAEITVRPDDARLQSYLGLTYAGTRQKEPAIAHGKKAVELLPTSKEAFDAPFWVVNLAETMVIFGEYDAAVEQLQLLLSIPGFVSIPYLKLDPLWIPLHGHPGFQRLLQGA